jgi:hypothetical protein
MTDGDLFWMPILLIGVPVAIAWALALRQALRLGRRASEGGKTAHSQEVRASFLLGALLLAGFLALALVPLWFQAVVPPSLIRRTEIGLLAAAEVVYVIAMATAILALIPLLTFSILPLFRPPTSDLRPSIVRWLALTISFLLAAAAAEAAAAACLWARTVPMPWLPIRFDDPPGENVVDILVIGESSARGVPYDRWLSVPDIVAWKLGEAFPHLAFQVENQAAPGLSLQAMHTKLAGLKRRPELAILYAGHNEFMSRYDWAAGAYHYADESPPPARTLQTLAERISPLLRLMSRTAQSLRTSTPPPRIVTRQLVDVPVYTAEEYAERLREFGARLGAIVNYLEWIGARIVLVIPPGNDVGFEPNRSFLSRGTPRALRAAFASEFLAARRDEVTDSERAVTAYRRLLERQPSFAETHFRLARLLERTKRWDEALLHYVAARDLDGLPMRMPSDFQGTYRDVAARHPRAILVDGPAELRATADHGLAGDVYFTDGLHPSLIGYTVLAQSILTKLHQERVLGWPTASPPPVVTPRDCAIQFKLDLPKWQIVCGYSAWFYNRTAFIRHDPSERLAKAARYAMGVKQLAAGASLDSLRIPGLGLEKVPGTFSTRN